MNGIYEDNVAKQTTRGYYRQIGLVDSLEDTGNERSSSLPNIEL